jgi:hypothetical protein
MPLRQVQRSVDYTNGDTYKVSAPACEQQLLLMSPQTPAAALHHFYAVSPKLQLHYNETPTVSAL